MNGTITDKWGALIPNAKVEAKSFDGKIIVTRTNDDGHYQLELIEGEYDIEITLTPYDKFLEAISKIVSQQNNDTSQMNKA